MYTGITEQCKAVIDGSSRNFAAFFVAGQTEYRNIKSIRLSAASTADGQISIGDTASACIEIIAEISGIIIPGQKISVYEGVRLDDGNYENIPMGVFWVKSSQEKDGLVTITAGGAMSMRLEEAYFSKLDYPAATIAMLQEISAMTDTSINTAGLETLTVKKKPEGYTCREIVGYIASKHGCFASEERDGSISLRWYAAADKDIFTDRSNSPEMSQSDYVVGRIRCNVSNSETYMRGSGASGIDITNPLMTESDMDRIWEKIGGYVYRPASFDVRLGNPCIDVWDTFICKGHNIICGSLEYKHDGGLSNTISSKGEAETETNFKGPTARFVDRMTTELALINEAMISKLSVDEAEARYFRAEKFDAIVATMETTITQELKSTFVTAETLKSKYTDTETLKAEYASITFSNVAKETIGTMLANVGLLTSATIHEGHVTGFLDSVEINANSITAGTIIADRLLLKGSTDGLLYALNNLGELTSTVVDTLDGYILSERTVTADKIVAKSITANEIAAGTINADNLNVANIFGNTAVLNTITASSIFSNAIAANSVVVGASNNAAAALSTANAARKTIYHTVNAGGTTNTHLRLAKIEVTGTYSGQPIKITVVQRYGEPSTVWIGLNSSEDTSTTALGKFAKTGTVEFCIAKTGAAIWGL